MPRKKKKNLARRELQDDKRVVIYFSDYRTMPMSAERANKVYKYLCAPEPAHLFKVRRMQRNGIHLYNVKTGAGSGYQPSFGWLDSYSQDHS